MTTYNAAALSNTQTKQFLLGNAEDEEEEEKERKRRKKRRRKKKT